MKKVGMCLSLMMVLNACVLHAGQKLRDSIAYERAKESDNDQISLAVDRMERGEEREPEVRHRDWSRVVRHVVVRAYADWSRLWQNFIRQE